MMSFTCTRVKLVCTEHGDITLHSSLESFLERFASDTMSKGASGAI